MSNQRRGKMHAAALNDRADVSLKSLIQYAKEAQEALEASGDENGAYVFEMFHEYLQRDVANGKPFKFASIQLGL